MLDWLFRRKKEKRMEEAISALWEWVQFLHKNQIELKSSLSDRISVLEKGQLEILEILGRKQKKAPEEIKVGKKDHYLLQLLHQNAAFDEESAIPTSAIYQSLPFPLTLRGLRKKLELLEAAGMVCSTRKGNRKCWHLAEGALLKLRSKGEGERN